MRDELVIRAMRADEWGDVAELIHLSTNYWYEVNRRLRIFACLLRRAPGSARCTSHSTPAAAWWRAMAAAAGWWALCFDHPRPTHVSLGIMNAHPSHAGLGVLLRDCLPGSCRLPANRRSRYGWFRRR